MTCCKVGLLLDTWVKVSSVVGFGFRLWFGCLGGFCGVCLGLLLGLVFVFAALRSWVGAWIRWVYVVGVCLWDLVGFWCLVYMVWLCSCGGLWDLLSMLALGLLVFLCGFLGCCLAWCLLISYLALFIYFVITLVMFGLVGLLAWVVCYCLLHCFWGVLVGGWNWCCLDLFGRLVTCSCCDIGVLWNVY